MRESLINILIHVSLHSKYQFNKETQTKLTRYEFSDEAYFKKIWL